MNFDFNISAWLWTALGVGVAIGAGIWALAKRIFKGKG